MTDRITGVHLEIQIGEFKLDANFDVDGMDEETAKRVTSWTTKNVPISLIKVEVFREPKP